MNASINAATILSKTSTWMNCSAACQQAKILSALAHLTFSLAKSFLVLVAGYRAGQDNAQVPHTDRRSTKKCDLNDRPACRRCCVYDRLDRASSVYKNGTKRLGRPAKESGCRDQCLQQFRHLVQGIIKHIQRSYSAYIMNFLIATSIFASTSSRFSSPWPWPQPYIFPQHSRFCYL